MDFTMQSQPLVLSKSGSSRHRHHRHHHDDDNEEKRKSTAAHSSSSHHHRRSSHHDQDGDDERHRKDHRHHHAKSSSSNPHIVNGLTTESDTAGRRHRRDVKMLPAVTPVTSVSSHHTTSTATSRNPAKTFVNGGRCGRCNLCTCACANSNNPFSGCGSPFIDDGSYLNVTENQLTVPYGFVSGRDAVTFSMAAVTGSETGDILLTPTGTLAAMQAATGLSALTQTGQTFFIGSITANDSVIALANGLFEIVGLPTAWKSTYVIRPKTAIVRADAFGCGCSRRLTTLGLNDLIHVLYAAPTVKPCVSGNHVYYTPGNWGNFANALIYQITAVTDTVPPAAQPWVVTPSIISALLSYRRISAASIPGC